MPALLWTTRSPKKPLSTVPRIEVEADAATMVMNPTSPTPIISAAAVAEVRLGLRMAFSRASRPEMPRTRGSGQARAPASGRATTGPSTATPRKVRAAPSPTRATALSTCAPRPTATRATPPARTSAPARARASERPDSSIATSRMAAMGGTREALRAGKNAEARVTTTPMASGTTTAVGSTVNPDVGMSIWRTANVPEQHRHRARRTPSADARTPVTRA